MNKMTSTFILMILCMFLIQLTRCTSYKKLHCERNLIIFPSYMKNVFLVRVVKQILDVKYDSTKVGAQLDCEMLIKERTSLQKKGGRSLKVHPKYIAYKVDGLKYRLSDTTIAVVDSVVVVQSGYSVELWIHAKDENGQFAVIVETKDGQLKLEHVLYIENGKIFVPEDE